MTLLFAAKAEEGVEGHGAHLVFIAEVLQGKAVADVGLEFLSKDGKAARAGSDPLLDFYARYAGTELQNKVIQTLAANEEIVQVHGFYYSEKDKMLSVDVVPDISVHDDAALICKLTAQIEPFAPGLQVTVVVDHNYCE